MEIKLTPINKIITSFNHRTRGAESEDLSVLMSSIKENGLLQPIELSPKGDKFEIVFGNRRLQAFIKLGKKEIPAIIHAKKDQADLVIRNVVENLEREDVSYMEIGFAINNLLKKEKLTMKEIAARLGINEAAVGDYLAAFNHIPADFKDKITNSKGRGKRKKNHISFTDAKRVAYAVKGKDITNDEARELLKDIYNKKISNTELTLILKKIKMGAQTKDAKKEQKKLTAVVVQVFIDTKIYDLAKNTHGVGTIMKILKLKIKEVINELSIE